MSLDIGYVVIVLVVIIISMTLHEVMHGFIAYRLGDNTAKDQGRLTLNPIKHLDPFLSLILPLFLALVGAPIFGGAKPVPYNPANVKGGEWGAALVAVAGPLTNLLIAFVSFGIWVIVGMPNVGIIGKLFTALVSVNLGFFAFNILPIPPLDGSRVLYALAPEFVRRGMEYIERFGIMIVFILVFIGSSILGSLMSSIVTFFIGVFSAIFMV